MGIHSKKWDQLYFREWLFGEQMRGKEAKNPLILVRLVLWRWRMLGESAKYRITMLIRDEVCSRSCPSQAESHLISANNLILSFITFPFIWIWFLGDPSKGLEIISCIRLSLCIRLRKWNLYLPVFKTGRSNPLWKWSKPSPSVLWILVSEGGEAPRGHRRHLTEVFTSACRK